MYFSITEISKSGRQNVSQYTVSIMIELYKVHKIKLSLLDHSSHKPFKDIQCEFGRVMDDCGILFFETHIFNEMDFALFNYDSLGCPASAKMSSFEDIEIEIPFMIYIKMSTKENKVTFKSFDFISVYEEDVFYTYQKEKDEELLPNQLLRIDFWGLDLLIPSWPVTSLIVNDAPFDIQIQKDDETHEMFATFPINEDVVHNTLTLELFQLFRYSLVGYLSLINGAQVQITKEYYNGFIRIYSYNRIENTGRSNYACGNAHLFRPAPILFEFDNYVRWNQLLDLNKFIYHLCSAQQLLYCEDSAFILILVLEGLCKRYISIHNKEKNLPTIISQEAFEEIKEKFNDILEKYDDIPPDNIERFKNAINKLNDVSTATSKFYLILDELNIQQTEEIKKLIKKVRNTLVHDAVLRDYYDYVLLSELIREFILRLISSTIERHSEYKCQAIIGDAKNLSYSEHVAQYNLNVDDNVIFSQYDERIKLRIIKGEMKRNEPQKDYEGSGIKNM